MVKNDESLEPGDWGEPSPQSAEARLATIETKGVNTRNVERSLECRAARFVVPVTRGGQWQIALTRDGQPS
jgi:hypothetical protein